MLAIIKQGLMHHLRQTKWVMFNALFPIFLMVLLGSMVSVNINEDNEINIFCYSDSESFQLSNELKEVFNAGNINIEKMIFKSDGEKRVQSNDGVLVIIENNNVKVQYSSRLEREGEIVLSYIKTYSDAKSTITEMYNTNFKEAEKVLKEPIYKGEISVELIDENSAPTGYQYYGICELTMMIFYSCLFPIGLMGTDERRNMKQRISMYGLSDFKYFIGRIISSFILSFIILIPGFIFSIFIMKSNWGSNPILTAMYMLPFAFMIITLGVVVGYLAKEREKSTLILQTLIIPILSFLGGAFIMLPEDPNNILNILSNISPLRWVNKGIFQVAYEGSFHYLNISLIINLGVSMVLLGILYFCIRREKKYI